MSVRYPAEFRFTSDCNRDHFRYSSIHLLCVAFAPPTLTLLLGEYLIEGMLSDWEVRQTPSHRHWHNNNKAVPGLSHLSIIMTVIVK